MGSEPSASTIAWEHRRISVQNKKMIQSQGTAHQCVLPVSREYQEYSPIRNLAILADFVCITTSNSHHLRDGGSVRGAKNKATEGIMHTMFARIARFRIRESIWSREY